MDIKSIEISCGLKRTSEEEITSKIDSHFSKEYLSEEEELECLLETSDKYDLINQNEFAYYQSSEVKENNYNQRIPRSKSKENIPPNADILNHESIDYLEELFESIFSNNGYDDRFEKPKMESNTKIENHFIDVGSLTFGGIFSLGEKLEHRVIMARTTVQCLMLPRYWLLERDQNPGNVWQRRRFYLDSTIPSREQLFKDFLTTRKWQQFKTHIISSNLTRHVGNSTKVQDIPIICRIVEPNED